MKQHLPRFNFKEKPLVLQALQTRVAVNGADAKLYGTIPTKFSYHCTNMGIIICIYLSEPIGWITPGLEGVVVSKAICPS